MTYFDHYYGRPIVAELSDDALLDEAVGIELGRTELTSEDDLNYAAAVEAEIVRRGIGARIGALVREIREAEAHLDACRYWSYP